MVGGYRVGRGTQRDERSTSDASRPQSLWKPGLASYALLFTASKLCLIRPRRFIVEVAIGAGEGVVHFEVDAKPMEVRFGVREIPALSIRLKDAATASNHDIPECASARD